MLSAMTTDLILIFLLLLISWLVLRPILRQPERDAINRLDVRLDEQLKRLASLEEHLGELRVEQLEASARLRESLGSSFASLREELRMVLAEHNTRFDRRQSEALRHLFELLQNGMTQLQTQLGANLARSSEEIGKRMDGLARQTDARLQVISTQVEKRLAEGFEKTTSTFTDILQRLSLIDEAQKKITELSSNVVSLQEVLADKRSRGAFGEVQLGSLVANILPENSYHLQYTLPNESRADCAIFLPAPTGTVMIDAKFPLESYRLMTDLSLGDADRKQAEKLFKQDINRHIQDIAGKYILPGITSDGAIMFIPAEAVFAEIQGHHPDLVEKAHAARVWMVSPTTLWAVLNTARAVLKDEATRKQVHIIQEHLGILGKDFRRFQGRMDDLAKHIRQAHEDVERVNTSAKKISARFDRIEKVDLPENREGRGLQMAEPEPLPDPDRPESNS